MHSMCLILWDGDARDMQAVASNILVMKDDEILCFASSGNVVKALATTDVTVRNGCNKLGVTTMPITIIIRTIYIF